MPGSASQRISWSFDFSSCGSDGENMPCFLDQHLTMVKRRDSWFHPPYGWIFTPKIISSVAGTTAMLPRTGGKLREVCWLAGEAMDFFPNCGSRSVSCQWSWNWKYVKPTSLGFSDAKRMQVECQRCSMNHYELSVIIWHEYHKYQYVNCNYSDSWSFFCSHLFFHLTQGGFHIGQWFGEDLRCPFGVPGPPTGGVNCHWVVPTSVWFWAW